MIHRKILYAHRGASREHPENTLPAFDCALRYGCHAIETDAHMSADGHVVLSHDPTGARNAGIFAPIRETVLADLQQWDIGQGIADTNGQGAYAQRAYRIPTLEEALLAFPNATFNVDAKQVSPDMTQALVSVVRRHHAQARVTITSFSDAVLHNVRRTHYEGKTGLARLEVLRLAFTPRPILRALPLHGHAAQVPLRYGPLRFDTHHVINKCHALGLRVDFWVVNDPNEGRRLLALGADGLVTDDPKTLAPLFM